MKNLTIKIIIALTLGWGATLVALGILTALRGTHLPVALAQGTIRYVAGATGNDGGNDCTNNNTPCATIQYAVDVAAPGDEIQVATGVYTDVQVRTGITQVVYISKTVTVRGGYTTSNWALSDPETNPTTLDAQGQGRVLFIIGDNISPTIEGLSITNGDATGLGGGTFGRNAGGGIYVITATAFINNNQVFSNTAVNGPGLFINDGLGVVLGNNTISENSSYGSAPTGGGLHFINSRNVTLTDNTIISNSAGCCGGTKAGGGLFFRGTDHVTLTGNLVSSNRVGNLGGGLFIKTCNYIKLIDNVISNNIGGNGGGLRVEGNSANIELSNNVISGNAVSRAGGGASFVGSDRVTLMGNTIINNNTPFQGPAELDDFGAGLHFFGTTNVNLVDNIITNNGPMVTLGGGVYVNSSTITMTNNVIADNQVEEPDGKGSGLYIESSSPRLLHTTIVSNSGGDGSGVHITGTFSTVALTNTIIASHTVGITIASGNTATLNGVLWDNNTANMGGMGTITITNAYSGEAAFAEDGYHLTASSAAIDRGVDAGVKEDIDGNLRPVDGNLDGVIAADLGADEFPNLSAPSLSVTKHATPNPVQAGQQLTYTLRVTNTGNVTLTATITDILPSQVSPTGEQSWTATIPVSGVWTQQLTVTVASSYSGPLTNTVLVTTAEGATGTHMLETSAVSEPGIYIYLPIILRN